MKILLLLIILFTGLSGILFLIKSRLKNDISLLGATITRIFLLYAIYLFSAGKADLIVVHLGVLVVAISDATLNLLYVLSRKYYKEIEHNKLVKAFSDLQNKYFTVVEHAQVGIYMLDENFRFEFVNNTMAEILECDKLHIYTKTPFDFIVKEQHDRLKSNLDKLVACENFTTDSEYTIRTCSGKVKKIRVVSDRTANGHITITGSALLLK